MKKLLLLGVLAIAGAMLGCARGPVGATGATGPAGTSVANSTFCTVDALVGGATLTFEYEDILYTSGDRMTLCAISDDTRTYSNQSFYDRRETTGTSATGQCVVTYDNTAAARYWAFFDNAPGARAELTNPATVPPTKVSTVSLTSGCTTF